ncbi:MAG: Ig-like domain repeat protein [Rudaea sp.]|uniref:Ig-like domain repeat protein n=1 Tax=Rudaea sp. TaxID=2136325 RepID=UPI0039E655A7
MIGFWISARQLCRTAVALFALCLGACHYATLPQWVEAPVVADGATANFNGPVSAYAGNNASAGLPVDQSDEAYVRLSLATLPGADAVQFSTSGSALSVGASGYVLDASKVVHARLVLYASNVRRAGRLRLSALSNSTNSLCWTDEDSAPTCTSEVSTGAGEDPDDAGKDVVVAEPGFYSFDVTSMVKSWIGSSSAAPLANNGLRIRALANDDGSYGDFTFVSKETATDQNKVRKDAQLFVTLSDAIGFSVRGEATATVSESAPATNFSASPDLAVDGTAGARRFGLAYFKNPLSAGLLNKVGTFAVEGAYQKTTIVSYLNSAADAPGADAASAFDVFRTNAFDATQITWNTWTPPAGSPAATNAFVAKSRQTLLSNASADYAQLCADAYNGNGSDAAVPNYYVAFATNLAATQRLDSAANATTGHKPRILGAYGPLTQPRGNTIYDSDDDYFPWVLDISTGAIGGAGGAMRARIGQTFPFRYVRAVYYPPGTDNANPFGVPISLVAPDSGASASFPTLDFELGDFDVQGGYWLYPVKANRTVGSYVVKGSTPGHNLRADIPFENLPLPVPSLSGPATVSMGVGATTVTVAAGAAAPFTLHVDDAVVDANIDDTTKWKIASSVASDTVPGTITQTDGAVNFAMTFASVGPRTLTVTSIGDGSIVTTLDVTVTAQSQTLLAAQGSIPVHGQPSTLSASVTYNNGVAVPDGGTVTFRLGTVVLGTATTWAGNVSLTLSNLATGVNGITAEYAGDASSHVEGSTSATVDYAVDQAGTVVTLSAPASATVGQAVWIGATVAARLPGAGTPAGTLTISDGAVSCSYSVPAAAAGCNLTLASPGGKTVTANYSGNDDFLSSGSTTSLTVQLADQAALTASATPPSIAYNGTSTLSTTGGSGTGAVSYQLTSGPCSLSGSTLTGTGVGTCVVLATKAADANYGAATANVSVAVGIASQTITFTSTPPVSPVVGGTYTVSATGGASGHPVTFSIDPASTAGACSIAGSTVTFTGAGTCLIDADQAGDANYATASAQQTIAVGKDTTTLTLSATPSPSMVGAAVTITATVAGDPPTGAVTFCDGAATSGASCPGTTLCAAVPLSVGATSSMAVCTATFTTIGTHTLSAYYAGDDNFVATATAQVLVTAVNAPAVPAPLLNRWTLLLLAALVAAFAYRRARGLF